MKKIILSIIAILLALASSLLAPMQTFAAANTKYYIEDMVIISTNTAEDLHLIVGDQYSLITTPIYDGGTKKDGESGRWKRSYLCYKVTTDPSKAITDIKALNMNAPWDYDAYNQRLAQIKVEVAEEADALAEAVYEFQNNYGEDLPKSKYVYKMLQYLYDDKSESRLGNLFADLDLKSKKKNDKEKLVNILLMGNAQCINVIYNALTLSCSETNNYNFLDIISDEGFNANTYINETKYASMAQDIIDTISVTQEELKKYERSLNDEEANVFTAPTDADLKAIYDTTYDMVKDLMAEDRNGAGIFDQYIKLVLGKDPATLTPAERRMMIETGLVNVAWYAMESQDFTSMQDVYGYMPTVISMFQNKKITADAYKKKVDQEIDSHKTGEDLPEYFIDYLELYSYDFDCYTQHLLDITENRTGEQLAKILHSCAYHGYNNEYQDLYDLIMAHDMTVPEGKRNGKYELSDFYPIIAQLSPGQRGMLKTGLLNLILSVEVDEEEYKKSFDILKEMIKEFANSECYPPNGKPDDPYYSIYINTDESLFEENSGVAMMKSAIESQKEYSYANTYGIIFACIGAFGGAVALGSLVTASVANDIAMSAEATVKNLVNTASNAFKARYGAAASLESIYSAEGAEAEVLMCRECLNAKTEFPVLQAASAKNVVAQTVSKAFTYVFAIAMLVLTIVLTTLAIMSLFVPIGSNDYLEIPRAICAERDICTYMVNLNGTVSVNRNAKGLVYYYGVKNPYLKKGNAPYKLGDFWFDPGEDPTGNDLSKYQVADVANWSQTSTERQWIALYTTKDIRAGQPILADSLVIDGNSWVTNANTVSIFDETKPCNMQYYLEGATSGKYLHYKVDETYDPYKAAEDKVNNTAASVFAEPVTYVVGGATLIIGFGAGCGITVFAQKKRKNENA